MKKGGPDWVMRLRKVIPPPEGWPDVRTREGLIEASKWIIDQEAAIMGDEGVPPEVRQRAGMTAISGIKQMAYILNSAPKEGGGGLPDVSELGEAALKELVGKLGKKKAE